jgi:hypothetical protein
VVQCIFVSESIYVAAVRLVNIYVAMAVATQIDLATVDVECSFQSNRTTGTTILWICSCSHFAKKNNNKCVTLVNF